MLTFSIITPTIQRPSLVNCCLNIDMQTYAGGWEHFVRVDCEKYNEELMERIARYNRLISKCSKPHVNGGNTCRHEVVKEATGTYIYFHDDDNILADNRVLEDVAAALESAGRPPWALFPITRLEKNFYTDPPRSCHVDTMNIVLRRDIAYWPDTDAYGTDGILVDDLIARGIPYAAFPDFRPIGIIPKISFCRE